VIGNYGYRLGTKPECDGQTNDLTGYETATAKKSVSDADAGKVMDLVSNRTFCQLYRILYTSHSVSRPLAEIICGSANRFTGISF